MFIKFINLLNLSLFYLLLYVNGNPCNLRKYSDGYVCVCNETYCDTLNINEILPNSKNKFTLISSSKGGLRFNVTHGTIGNTTSDNVYYVGRSIRKLNTTKNNFRRVTEETKLNGFNQHRGAQRYQFSTFKIEESTIIVQRNVTYQTIIGFGGAFTGSVSYLLDKLSKNLQRFIYNSYYSLVNGIGYNLMRIPIGGCDFDLSPWAYNELPINDKNLSNFTKLDDRDLQKIRQINDLKNTTNNRNIKVIGAAWSSPPWMKNNNDWTGRSYLKSEFYQTWANYHLKYLELMEDNNFTFWGISTGNEPLNGHYFWLFVHFMSLGWSAAEQGKWVGENLGPTLKQSKFKNVKILGSDDQRYVFPWWFEQMDHGHENATKYLDGFGVHWYWDKIAPPSLLDRTHKDYPNKFILNTESCIGDKPFDTHGPKLGSWSRAEDYIEAFIQDLQHWVNGWVDWNLILDLHGGPNYVKNYVEAPIIVNSTDFKEIYKQPIFYAIGHFSKFIDPNSVRINVKSTNKKIITIGFQGLDRTLTIIIYNKSSRPAVINLYDEIKGRINIQLPAKSIHTLIYEKF